MRFNISGNKYIKQEILNYDRIILYKVKKKRSELIMNYILKLNR